VGKKSSLLQNIWKWPVGVSNVSWVMTEVVKSGVSFSLRTFGWGVKGVTQCVYVTTKTCFLIPKTAVKYGGVVLKYSFKAVGDATIQASTAVGLLEKGEKSGTMSAVVKETIDTMESSIHKGSEMIHSSIATVEYFVSLIVRLAGGSIHHSVEKIASQDPIRTAADVFLEVTKRAKGFFSLELLYATRDFVHLVIAETTGGKMEGANILYTAKAVVTFACLQNIIPPSVFSQLRAKRHPKRDPSLRSHYRRYSHNYDTCIFSCGEMNKAEPDWGEVLHYMKFASGVYGWFIMEVLGIEPASSYWVSNEETLSKHTNIPQEDIIFAEWFGSIFRPAFYVAVDRKHKSIIVSIRGTSSFMDFMTDLCCFYVPYVAEETNPPIIGNVHKGMYESAEYIDASICDGIETLLKKDEFCDFGVVVVGHSLGAGVGTLLTLLWRTKFSNLRCYSFAGPAVMSEELCPLVKNIITSYVIGDDFCPRLSLGSMLDLRSVVVNLCSETGMTRRIFKVILRSLFNSQLEDFQWCESVVSVLRADMQNAKLYPPGKLFHIVHTASDYYIHHLYNDNEMKKNNKMPRRKHKKQNVNKLSCLPVDPNHFSEIFFSWCMFLDHLPNTYENTFEALLNQSTM